MERDPAAVLQAAIRGVVERLPEAIKVETPVTGKPAEEFQPSKSFQGPRAGYYFASGSNGVGYYLDPLAPKLKVEDEQQKAPKAPVIDAEELLKEAEQQAGVDEVQLLDAKSLRRHVAIFERKYKENLEMRMKYADNPEKFMESEVDLDEEVQRLLAVAGSPELYPDFVKLGAVQNLLALLSHENTDIAADVIELFQQLTDADVIEDSVLQEEEAAILVESMLEHNAIELLVQRLNSLAEANPDEANAVFNILSIFENMVEVKPEVAEMVYGRSKLLKWMLARLRPREFDSNKQSCSELLAILLQSSPLNQQRLADTNGIDVLLQAIAPYKNRNPASIDEEEFLENLFNALCSCLMSPETRTLFLKAEGVELMLLILKQKRIARSGALKALDFATTRSPANCERFVDQFGLKTIFSIFMGKSKLKRRKGEEAQEEAQEEERALSVIANLFQGLARGSRRDRLAAKFVENEFEKCDRLMELYARYHNRVHAEEAVLEEDGGMEMTEEDRLLVRMDAGLYSLQQCALVVGHLWFVGDMGVRKRLLQLLHQQGMALASVRGVLKEFLANIGDEGSPSEAERERNRVKRMLVALGYDEATEPEILAPEPEEHAPLPPPEDEPMGNGEAPEEEDPFQLGSLDAGIAEPLATSNGKDSTAAEPELPVPSAKALSSEEPADEKRRQHNVDIKEPSHRSRQEEDKERDTEKATTRKGEEDEEEDRKPRRHKREKEERADDGRRDRHKDGKHKHRDEKESSKHKHRDRDDNREKRRREEGDRDRDRKRERR